MTKCSQTQQRQANQYYTKQGDINTVRIICPHCVFLFFIFFYAPRPPLVFKISENLKISPPCNTV